jgi:hypothetical protein
LALAQQVVEFRLHRTGAELESEADLTAGSAPTSYRFDRPFLVLMRKRGAVQPFLAVWVDGAELLERWQ